MPRAVPSLVLHGGLLIGALVIAALLPGGCGGSGGSSDPVLLPPRIDAIDVTLDALAGTPYVITGAQFPGPDGSTFAVRFRAGADAVFGTCGARELTGVVTRTSDSTLTGTVPVAHVLADATAHVAVDFPSGTVVSGGAIAMFRGTPDPDQDQDGNGIRDACDPRTYDFEPDALGGRPADVTQLGFPTGFEVADVAGDRVARYTGTSTGTHDRLDRVVADHAWQDTTVYVDWDDTPSVGSIELWSEGSFSDNAGSGIILQIRSGLIYFFQRTYRSVPSIVGPALPANGRMRVRLIKGTGTTSTVHVDAWSGSAWTEDHAVFPIADDSNLRGRNTVFADYSLGTRGIRRITVVHADTPPPLTILETPDALTPWRLYQRGPDDTATLEAHVAYRTDAPARLEARVVRIANGLVLDGHDFADHGMPVPAATRGRLRFALPGVPTGGNYDVHIRLLDGDGALLAQAGVREVAVGDIYICAGQSNMSGYSGNLVGATTPVDGVHRFHNDGRWAQAAEPMDASALQTDAVSLENPLHSLMLPFARDLLDATGVPIGLVPTSLGGTNLHTQWQRNATRPDWRATLYGSMLHRARTATGGLPPAGFLWFQGESDALGGRTTAQYAADLDQLLAHVRSDLGAPDLPAVIAQLGTYSAAPLELWLAVQEAQRQVARTDARTALVTTVDQPRSDAIHFNVAGYQGIGHRFAEALRVLGFGQAVDPLAELTTAAPGAAANEIVLTYDAPISGGATALFHAGDDSGALTVTAVSVSGSTVTLTLDRDLATAPFVSYGYAVDPTAAWVVDAAGVPVPAFHRVPVE